MINTENTFATKLAAIALTLLVSATMVLGAVGPAAMQAVGAA